MDICIIVFSLLFKTVFSNVHPFPFEDTIFQKTDMNRIPVDSTAQVVSTSAFSIIDCSQLCANVMECHLIYYSMSSRYCKGYSHTSWVNSVFLQQDNTTGFIKQFNNDCVERGYIFASSVNLCFSVFLDTNEWNDSRGLCQVEGADLIVLDTDEKIQFLTDYIASKYSFGYWHIGMVDVNEIGTWKWINGKFVNTTMAFFDSVGIQTCGALRIPIQKVVDASCTTKRRRICELQI